LTGWQDRESGAAYGDNRQTTGLPLATIVDIDRRLAQARLRTIGVRGLSAARMTPLDAARLLTAVLARPQANASAEGVERYAQTRIDKAWWRDGLFGPADLDDFVALPSRLASLSGPRIVGKRKEASVKKKTKRNWRGRERFAL